VLEKKFCVHTLQQVRSMYLYLNTMNETKSCVWFVYGYKYIFFFVSTRMPIISYVATQFKH